MQCDYDQNDLPLLLQAVMEGWPTSKEKKQDVIDVLHEIVVNPLNRPSSRVNAARAIIDADKINVEVARVIVSAQAVQALGKEKAREQYHVDSDRIAAKLVGLLTAPEAGESAADLERDLQRPRLSLDGSIELDDESGPLARESA